MFKVRLARRARPRPRGHSFLPMLSNGGADQKKRSGLDACLTAVRCPCCRAELVPRFGPRGPYFHCRCHEEKQPT